MGSFLVMVYHLLKVVNETEGMCLFVKVLCKTGRVAIVIERFIVFIVTYRKATTGLSDVYFVAVWAGGRVPIPSRFPMVLLVRDVIFSSAV